MLKWKIFSYISFLYKPSWINLISNLELKRIHQKIKAKSTPGLSNSLSKTIFHEKLEILVNIKENMKKNINY